MASQEAKKRAALGKVASGQASVRKDLFNRINNRIKDLRKVAPGGNKIPLAVAPHVIHHWIWDSAKGVETTHAGLYHAMVKFSPTRKLNDRGGAVYSNDEGHRAVQTSSRSGVRVYGPGGRRIGAVFGTIEKAERHLAELGK